MSIVILRQIIVWGLLWLSLAFVGACHIVRFQGSLAVITHQTSKTGYRPIEYYDTLQEKVMRLIAIGDSTKSPVLFIHGSPSSLMEWMTFLQDTSFLKQYYILAIDRPGYGMADFGNLEMDLHKQSMLLYNILKKAGIHKSISVVGSSYGGSLAACYAMDYPQSPNALILMYASVMPGAEKTYQISYALKYPLVERLTPALLTMSASEKFNHSRLLTSLTKWDSILCPTLIIHGTADSLIYYKNAIYAQSHITHAKVTLRSLTGYRHAIMFSKPDLMKSILKGYLLQYTK